MATKERKALRLVKQLCAYCGRMILRISGYLIVFVSSMADEMSLNENVEQSIASLSYIRKGKTGVCTSDE